MFHLTYNCRNTNQNDTEMQLVIYQIGKTFPSLTIYSVSEAFGNKPSHTLLWKCKIEASVILQGRNLATFNMLMYSFTF